MQYRMLAILVMYILYTCEKKEYLEVFTCYTLISIVFALHHNRKMEVFDTIIRPE